MFWIVLAAATAHPADHYLSLSTISGGDIAQMCAQEPYSEQGVPLDPCNSYILGVADTLQLQRATCRTQSNAATLQTVAIVRRYIKDHPEEWGSHPAFIIRKALGQAFPCNR